MQEYEDKGAKLQRCNGKDAKGESAKLKAKEQYFTTLNSCHCNLICTFAFYFLSNNLMQVSYLPMVCFMLSNVVVMYAFSLKGEGKSAKARMRSCEGGGEIVLSLFHVTLSS